MLLAQMPNASTQEVNTVIWGLFGIIGILSVSFVGLAAARAFFAKKPDGDQYVSKGELKALSDSIDSDMGKMATSIDACATKTEVKELGEQLRQSVHKLRDDLQPMAIAVARVETKQENQDKQIAALAGKVDGSHDLLVEIRGIVRKNGANTEKHTA